MSYAVTEAGEQDMRAELKVLEALNEDIDQLTSEARHCETLCPEARVLLDMAWYFTEKAMRETTGHCSVHRSSGRCACCVHYADLKLKAERVRRMSDWSRNDSHRRTRRLIVGAFSILILFGGCDGKRNDK